MFSVRARGLSLITLLAIDVIERVDGSDGVSSSEIDPELRLVALIFSKLAP